MVENNIVLRFWWDILVDKLAYNGKISGQITVSILVYNCCLYGSGLSTNIFCQALEILSVKRTPTPTPHPPVFTRQ